MTALIIESLEKRFNGLPILKNISLSVAQGEFISLLGPSGCGKTTTLRCVAGFEQPDGGRILFGNQDMTAVRPERRDIGMVFQSYALFPHMTVAENVSFGLEARRVPRAEQRRRCAEVLAMVRLEGLEGRFPRELSGGQQQRVALARALVIEPSILLLDEPLANLDAALRDEMRFFIRDLQRRVGITSVYVTHDQAEAMVMSDRIVVMSRGEIAQVGSPREIYEQPTSASVASFIGRSNMIAGVVKDAGGGDRYQIDTPYGLMNTLGPAGLVTGAPIHIMFRPENVRVGEKRPGENTLPGIVTQSTYQGETRQLTVRLEPESDVVVDVEGKSRIAAGDRVSLNIAQADTWLLPK
jgi:putative spermidine/putrescine transport system ATP-binding protein